MLLVPPPHTHGYYLPMTSYVPTTPHRCSPLCRSSPAGDPSTHPHTAQCNAHPITAARFRPICACTPCTFRPPGRKSTVTHHSRTHARPLGHSATTQPLRTWHDMTTAAAHFRTVAAHAIVRAARATTLMHVHFLVKVQLSRRPCVDGIFLSALSCDSLSASSCDSLSGPWSQLAVWSAVLSCDLSVCP